MTGNLWFNGWSSLGRIEVYAVTSFALLVVLVRLLGKRTISKMNPSDFALTVAVGSVIANWILQSPVSLVDGVAGLTTLLLLQYGVEWSTTRSEPVRKVTEGAPTLLAYRGELLHDNMRRENVNTHEVYSALRQHGFGSLDEVGAVTLEIDGSFSVLQRTERKADLLDDVRRTVPQHHELTRT